jgi:HAD superfamily hydrolase (TIGR01509 family)
MSETLTAVRAAGFGDLIARARALIFDIDGTMAETEEVHRRAFNDAFSRAGLNWYWDQATYGQLLRVAGGKERIHAFAMRKRTMPLLSNREIAELHRIKTARYAELIATGGCPLRPGVEALLRNARRRSQRLAIATTTSRANIDALLSVTLGEDWAEWFEAIVAGDDVPEKKPAPDVYLVMLARLSLPASRCIAIEDSRNGLVAASRAGIPVLFTRSAYFRDDDCSEALLAVDELTEIAY